MAKILLVDDEPALRHLLADLLEAMGHHVEATAGASEAIRQYLREEPDVIISDSVMPGMSGFDLFVRLLPRINQRVPFIFVSAYTASEGVQAAIDAGAFDYLSKPIDITRLQEAVDEAVAQRRAWVRTADRRATVVAAVS
ncbi:MAG: response regulator [Planctomycetota bacterium]|jgi:two-component system response regulator PilR (NtrC family)